MMNDWFFAEQQSAYRRAALLGEAERFRLLRTVSGASLRERVAGGLIALATWLAPAVAMEARGGLIGAGQRDGERVLTGIVGS